MPLFINSTEFKGESTQLCSAVLKMKSTELDSHAKTHDTMTNIIEIYPRQAVFLDASSCYKLKNSSSFQHLNGVYLADFNLGVLLHIRNQYTASYTAYLDPFTAIRWEPIFRLFTASMKEADKFAFEIHLGFIKLKDAPDYLIITHIITQMLNSLVDYLKDKPIDINFCATYHLVDSQLLDSANSTHLLVETTSGKITVCQPANGCYYPYTLHPIDRHALTTRTFDYTNDRNELMLIYNRNSPAILHEEFTQYCYNLSSLYREALNKYKRDSGYDLGFIVEYIKSSFTKLLQNNLQLEAFFKHNFAFFMKKATDIYTAIKIFPSLINDTSKDKLARSQENITRQEVAGDMVDDSPKTSRKRKPSDQSTAAAQSLLASHGVTPMWKKKSDGAKNQTKNSQAKNETDYLSPGILKTS